MTADTLNSVYSNLTKIMLYKGNGIRNWEQILVNGDEI